MTVQKRAGFSLVELVIVIVIIGIIAAIAVPRISRGARGASDSSLRGSLAVMRHAIDLYMAEHNGLFPTAADFAEQMTTYTNASGADVATKDATHIFGPYLKAVPGLPVKGTGTTGGALGDNEVAAVDGANVGWLYDQATGEIVCNTGTTEDEAEVAYNTY
ncbi:MAG: prepilin-type N-terminal cleavage/methylation domain-containing protein [bacterium]|nr:prepilin-type N-terminal cleavage/methylation domain-containing protein [bacterium]